MEESEFSSLRKSMGLSYEECAKMLGVSNARTVRKWEQVGGNAEQNRRPIPQQAAGTMRWVSNDNSPWLICESPDGSTEHIMHMVGPRFIAKIVNVDIEHSGFSYTCSNGTKLIDFIWFDPQPGLDLDSILGDAEAAIVENYQTMEDNG